jgi:hypothetical protein
MLLTGCSQGLSEEEKKAAKAHADNLCLIASQAEGISDMAQTVAGMADQAAVMGAKNDKESRFVIEGTRLARERGCVK